MLISSTDSGTDAVSAVTWPRAGAPVVVPGDQGSPGIFQPSRGLLPFRVRCCLGFRKAFVRGERPGQDKGRGPHDGASAWPGDAWTGSHCLRVTAPCAAASRGFLKFSVPRRPRRANALLKKSSQPPGARWICSAASTSTPSGVRSQLPGRLVQHLKRRGS
jgi:hypothetical protein